MTKKDFLEKPLQRKSVKVKGSRAFIEFNLPAGEYAISTYQDSN